MSWTWLELKQKHPRIDAGVVDAGVVAGIDVYLKDQGILSQDQVEHFCFPADPSGTIACLNAVS